MAPTPVPLVDSRSDRLLAYQRALGNFSRIATDSQSPDRLLQYATAAVAGVTHIGHVKLMRYRVAEGDLLIEAGVGWKPGVVGYATLAIDQASPAGRSLQTGAPVVVNDLANDPEYRMIPLLQEHGIVSLLNVPVRRGGRPWGVLEIDSERPRAFDQVDITFLATYASMLGLALQRTVADEHALESASRVARKEAEFELALQEVIHRTRNTFNFIVSFLTRERRAAENGETAARLGRAIDRVQAIAIAQDQLSARTGRADFGSYLRALCSNIDPLRKEVTIVVTAATLPIASDRAVLLGLIVNELVTNALKHAFAADGGTIAVTFAFDANLGEARLTVEDDGKGMGPARPDGLGLTLVRAFAAQLGGDIGFESRARGTCVAGTFPMPA